MNDSLIRPGQFVELSVDEFQATTTTSRWPRPSIWRGRRLRPTKPPWRCSKSKLTPERVSKSKCFHTRRWPLSSITTTFSAATGKYRRQRKSKVTDSNDWTKKSGIHIDAEFCYPFSFTPLCFCSTSGILIVRWFLWGPGSYSCTNSANSLLSG